MDPEGNKYDGALLAKVVEVVNRNAKGNVLVGDIKSLYELVVDANIYTETEQRTVQFICRNFKFTPASKKKLTSMLDDWVAEHGIKRDGPEPVTEPVEPAKPTEPIGMAKPEVEPEAVTNAIKEKSPEPETPPEPKPEVKVEVKEPVVEPKAEPVIEPKAEPVIEPEVETPTEPAPPLEPEEPVHPMKRISIAKVVANIGVGEAGEKLLKAESVLTILTGAKPVRTISRSTNRDLGIRKGAPLGCKVTLRGESAAKLLKEALWVRENRIYDYSISESGCLSFGIPDYTSFPDQKYNPDIGIFGLDISVVLRRPGLRVRHRRIHRSRVGRDQKITREEAKNWLVRYFQVEVVN